MAKLYLLAQDGTPVEAWEIGERPLAIGRGASAEVRIDDDGLSRRHFMISRDGQEYVVRDLSSRNGTWLAGERTTQAKLHHNDRILAGHTVFRFCEWAMQPAVGPNGTEILSCA